jgi:pimeloyl-ACP methyl ester carboxylesterase
MTARAQPDGTTIVLIHGLWLTPLSWEHWKERYEGRRLPVVAPTWPGMDKPIDELRRDPSSMNGVGVKEIADRYDAAIRGLAAPPIIIGHSFGAAVTEILLDRGLGVGVAGVAISPPPIKGVLRLPTSALRAGFPVLKDPANRKRTVGLTPAQFHYGFTNTLSEEEAQRVYDRYQVPGPGRPIFQSATANLDPKTPAKVTFKSTTRPPLLVIGAGKDHTVPASLSREVAKHESKAASVTGYQEYPDRSHWIIGQDGWEEVADYALDWALRHRAESERPA